MGSYSHHNIKDVEDYVRSVSTTSGLSLSEERLRPHFSDFRRLLNDIDILNDVVTKANFIRVGPVATYTHIKASLDSQ